MQLGHRGDSQQDAQGKQSSPLALAHRNNLPHLLIWYAECLKKSVKREAFKRWQRKKPSDARQEAVMTVLLVLMMFAIFLTIDLDRKSVV